MHTPQEAMKKAPQPTTQLQLEFGPDAERGSEELRAKVLKFEPRRSADDELEERAVRLLLEKASKLTW